MVGLGGFGLSAAINGGIALVVFTIFCIARRSPANRFVYAPRTLHPQFRGGRPPPPPLSSNLFSFIFEVLAVDRQTLIACAGLDAYMYCRWMELCTIMFAGMTVLGVGILVPVNYTAMGGKDGFDAVSMSNLPTNSVRLVAHLLVSYIFRRLDLLPAVPPVAGVRRPASGAHGEGAAEQPRSDAVRAEHSAFCAH